MMKSAAKTALLQWRIVPGTSINGERRQSWWRIHLHLHFTPLAVAGQIPGLVANYILVAQFGGDLLGNVAHLVDIVHAKHAPAGSGADVVEQLRAGALLGSGRVGI